MNSGVILSYEEQEQAKKQYLSASQFEALSKFEADLKELGYELLFRRKEKDK